VVIGSETSGGVKNISIANCVFDGTDRGIRIKSARGRGAYIEDIRVANIVMRNIRDEALVITTFYEKSNPETVTERTPVFRNIHINGVTGDARIAADLSGLTEMPLDDISISDFHIDANIGIGMVDVKNVGLHNVTINVKKGPVLVASHADGLEIDGLRTVSKDATQVLARLSSVKNVFIHGCSVFEASKEVIQVTQDSANQLQLEGNHFGKGVLPVIVKSE
jgi:polygalacturonase